MLFHILKKVISTMNNFKYNHDVKIRDKYTLKHCNEINSEINDYMKGSYYFLGFGAALKYYRDHNFFDEDFDYVFDSKCFDKLVDLPKFNKNFKLILEDWNQDLPIMVKMRWKKKEWLTSFL